MNKSSVSEFCCRDLFSIEELNGIQVLAGEKSLGNRITRVNIMEVPDVENWVHESEFLITTGYPFREDLNRMLELIPKLAQKKVAALGIKTKRYIEEVPKEIIQCAQEWELPLLELPEKTSFSNVVREVMEKIIFGESAYLNILQERIESISREILHDARLDILLQSIEVMLGNPVFIISDNNRCIATKESLKCIENNSESLTFENLLWGSNQKKAEVIVDKEKIFAYLYEIKDVGLENMVVVVLEKNLSCNTLDLLTMEHLISLLSIKIKTDNIYRSVEMKYLDQFLFDWISGGITTLRDFEMRTRLYGYHLSNDFYYKAIVVKTNDKNSKVYSDKELIIRYRNYESVIGTKSWLTIYDGKIVVLVAINPGAGIGEKTILQNIESTLQRLTGSKQLSLCISSNVPSPLSISGAYEEAKNIYISACIANCKESNITWEELGIYSILTMIKPGANIKNFMDKYIQPLLEYDTKQNANLLNTLAIYFKSGNSIKQTAANMYVHYNTILYRMEKIKKLLSIEMEDTEEVLKLNLAIKLNGIYNRSIEEEN